MDVPLHLYSWLISTPYFHNRKEPVQLGNQDLNVVKPHGSVILLDDNDVDGSSAITTVTHFSTEDFKTCPIDLIIISPTINLIKEIAIKMSVKEICCQIRKWFEFILESSWFVKTNRLIQFLKFTNNARCPGRKFSPNSWIWFPKNIEKREDPDQV